MGATPHRGYVDQLRPLLPAQALRRSPSKLAYAAAHLAVVGVGISLCRAVIAPEFYPLVGIAVGHSLACLAFFAHELSHHAVISPGRLCRALELLCWGMNAVPATLWQAVHNATHHLQTNTPRDPDRRWLPEEATPATRAYTTILYPHRRAHALNPLVLFQFVGYISRIVIAALTNGRHGLLPSPPPHLTRVRSRVLAELTFILGLHLALLAFLRFDWWAYTCLGPLALLSASSVVMAYVFTNHFLHPVADTTDPVSSSTSVIVPRWIDRLHLHFSYHTEHHLFPSMNSDYYPRLSEHLTRLYPHAYHRLPFLEAWRLLWASDPFAQRTTEP